MTAPFLQQIDWQRPWLRPLLSLAQPILQSADWRQALDIAAASIRNHRGLPIRFVAQAELPSGMPYEAFISNTGQVPTRDNLHDFFNALMWLTFPKTKVRLNALQAAEIARASSNLQQRGKLRDAATLFDENAALIVTRDPRLTGALRNHEWRRVFIDEREGFMHGCEVWLFGHALIEKLVSPYKAITAHAWSVEADDAFFSMSPAEKRIWIDERVAAQLAIGLSTADFTPLPVLGVPGWWKNQEQEFYEDEKVFRPKRAPRS